MEKSRLIRLSAVFISLYMAIAARGQTVEMGYTGPGGNNSGGIYTYPYNFTLDGSSQTYQLMCDDFNHSITIPENWTATTLDVPDLTPTTVLGLQFPSAGVTGYLEAADLFTEEVSAYNASNSDPEGLYNWAVWDLLTGSDVSAAALSAGDETQVQTYLSAAEALGPSLTPSDFSNVVIYTPTDMSSGGPQEFLGYGTPDSQQLNMPEPSTFGLLGVSVVGLMGRRRQTGGLKGFCGILPTIHTTW